MVDVCRGFAIFFFLKIMLVVVPIVSRFLSLCLSFYSRFFARSNRSSANGNVLDFAVHALGARFNPKIGSKCAHW